MMSAVQVERWVFKLKKSELGIEDESELKKVKGPKTYLTEFAVSRRLSLKLGRSVGNTD